MNSTATHTDITCDCTVHNSAVTIRVPSTMLVNPKPGATTTPRYVATVRCNLLRMNALVRKYPTV